jgi:Gram-negative bacterial TonB protein C-terminal
MLDERAMRFTVLAALMASLAVPGQPSWRPARAESVTEVSPPPPTVAGGGEVLLEVSVDVEGAVFNTRVLRHTPPFTDLLRQAVRQWRFQPAVEDGRAVPSRLLVAGVFRPPTLIGPAVGETPKDVAQPTADVPFPIEIVPPAFPPNVVIPGAGLTGLDAQTVVEIGVAADGKVQVARVLRTTAAAFDSPSLDAAGRWRFRGAGRQAFVYAVFGFRPPVVVGPPILPR